MRLLYLSPFPAYPLYGGAVVRNHHLGQALLKRHQVWASFCGADGTSPWSGEVPLSGTGRKALFDPPFLRRAASLIRREKIEAVVASSLIAGLHGALLARWSRLPFWMDEHNVEWHCGRRYGFWGWPLVYALEGFILKNADWVTCVSPEDQERLVRGFRLVSEKVRVAPNGVDFPALRASSQETLPPYSDSGRRTVLFFGVLNYPPNREAVRILAEEIAPAAPDDLDFVVAGTGGEELAALYPNLRFEGFVEDIHRLVRRCDGVLVPIRAGGGTRMKILESVACGRPVLSTVCGAEGLDREAMGSALTVTDDLGRTLAWLRTLPRQGEARAGERFEEIYSWETIWARTMPL